MIKVSDISHALEAFAPLLLQENYDNSGLQIGNPNSPVSNILICLSITEDIVKEAITKDCQMIVSHHPLIFHGLKHLTEENTTQRMVATAIRNNIAIYSSHTCLDSAPGGVSSQMARLLHLENLKALETSNVMADAGMGVIGELPNPLPAQEFLRILKSVFKVKALRYSKQSPQIVIKKIALCGGSGASLIPYAIKEKADAYVSGDIKYHDYDTYGSSLLLTDIGHYESEILTRNLLARIIKDAQPKINILISEQETNPIEIL